MHPSDRLLGVKSALLKDRHVVLGVSGSIAVVETVKLAHELKRHGARVTAVMTRAAQRFISPLALEYATGNPVVTELTGLGEHVALCDGRDQSGDVLLVAPATANTIAKLALGIDDTPVTSCATVALGAGVPVVVAPAMHDMMKDNPAVARRLDDLEAMGVHLAAPVEEEEKAKMADPGSIADTVVRALADGPWVGRKAVVVSGATAEPVDPIRVITNRSSGRMGVEVARSLYHSGAHVELWNAWGLVPLPTTFPTRRYETVEDLVDLVESYDWDGVDGVFMPAALSDFAPVQAKSKIGSEAQKVDVEMRSLPKVITKIRKATPKAVLVAFKAESDAAKLEARARDRLERYEADLVIANTTRGFGGDETEVLVVGRGQKKSRTFAGLKKDVAQQLVDEAGALLGTRGSE